MTNAIAAVPAQPAPSAGGASVPAPAPGVITKPEQLQKVSTADIEASLEAAVDAEIAGETAQPAAVVPPPAPVVAATPAPSPEPAAPVPPAPTAAAPAPGLDPAPAPAPVVDDEGRAILPDHVDKFRLSKGNVAGDLEWEMGRLLKAGFTAPEIANRLGLKLETVKPGDVTPPAAPGPDPVKVAQDKISEIQTQLATAITDMDTEAQARLTIELTDEKVAFALLQRDQQQAQNRQQQEQQTAFNEADAKAKVRAENRWPALKDPKSAFKAKTLELHAQNVREGRAVLDDPNYLVYLADDAGEALGMAPVLTAAPAAVVPSAAPVPPVIPPASGSAPQPGFGVAPGTAQPSAPKPVTESDIKKAMPKMSTKALDDALEAADTLALQK